DEDDVGGGDGGLDVGGEEEVFPAGLFDDVVETGLIDGQFVGVPRGDAGGVEIDHRDGDVGGFMGDHRRGGTTHVTGSYAANFHKDKRAKVAATAEKPSRFCLNRPGDCYDWILRGHRFGAPDPAAAGLPPLPHGGRSSDGLENHGGVLAAEAEVVAHGNADRFLAGLVGHVVEVAVGVRFVEVDGRGDRAFLNGFRADDGLDAAGGAEEVAGHGLGGADGDPAGCFAEDA